MRRVIVGLALLGVGFTLSPHVLTMLPALRPPGLALLWILLTPGTPLCVSRLSRLALLRMLLAPRLHSRPAFLESGFYFLAAIGLLGAALLARPLFLTRFYLLHPWSRALLVFLIGREGQGGKRHGRRGDQQCEYAEFLHA